MTTNGHTPGDLRALSDQEGQKTFTLTLDEIATLITAALLTGATQVLDGKLKIDASGSEIDEHFADCSRNARSKPSGPTLEKLSESFLASNPDVRAARDYAFSIVRGKESKR